MTNISNVAALRHGAEILNRIAAQGGPSSPEPAFIMRTTAAKLAEHFHWAVNEIERLQSKLKDVERIRDEWCNEYVVARHGAIEECVKWLEDMPEHWLTLAAEMRRALTDEGPAQWQAQRDKPPTQRELDEPRSK